MLLLCCSFAVTGEAVLTAKLLKPMLADCSINRRLTNTKWIMLLTSGNHLSLSVEICWLLEIGHLVLVKMVSSSGGLRQDFIVDKTTGHGKFIVYFADKKSTIGCCFVSCYCIVVDNVNKQIGFRGNSPPSCKQCPLIKAALTLFQPTPVPNIPYN